MPDETLPRLWFRALLPGGGAFGPGKAELLEAIRRTGSIAAAGRSMRMSYRRAWRMTDELNKLFETPLVEAERGGEAGGGSRLSPLGEAVLAAWRELDRAVAEAAGPGLRRLDALRAAPPAAPEAPPSPPPGP